MFNTFLTFTYRYTEPHNLVPLHNIFIPTMPATWWLKYFPYISWTITQIMSFHIKALHLFFFSIFYFEDDHKLINIFLCTCYISTNTSPNFVFSMRAFTKRAKSASSSHSSWAVMIGVLIFLLALMISLIRGTPRVICEKVVKESTTDKDKQKK